MQTGYKVTWTDRASKNVDEIIEYLEVQWDKKTANNFLADLHERVQLIAHNPEMFQESNKTGQCQTFGAHQAGNSLLPV